MSRRTLFALIVINTALYAALAVLYPLAQGLPNPRKMWAQQVNGTAIIGVAHVAIYVVLFAAYVIGVHQICRRKAAAPVQSRAFVHPAGLPLAIATGWMLCSLVSLFIFPGESADIFDYIFRGRMMIEYGLSPLSTTPFQINGMPFHRYVSWTQWVDAYGPLWEYASAGVAWGTRLLISPAEALVRINQTCDAQPAVCTLLAKYVIGYRLLAIGLTGLCGGLIWAIVKQPTLSPEPDEGSMGQTSSTIMSTGMSTGALCIWLWNPLVIISTAVGAHNDVLMLVFVLLAIWLGQRDRWVLALLALFAAAHVKLTALVLLPVLCLWLAQRLGWVRAIGVTLGSIATALPISFALYAPLGGWATLPRNLYER